MDYTVDYFIKKFEDIPEEMWITGTLINEKGQRCARGHCLTFHKTDPCSGPPFLVPNLEVMEEDYYLCEILGKTQSPIGGVSFPRVVAINNAKDPAYQQPTPKQRVLAALYDKKAELAINEAQEIVNTPIILTEKLELCQ